MALEEIIGRKLYYSKNLLDEHTISRVASTFRHIRQVCGDGNSFYRAVYFGLLELMTKEIISLADEEDDKASEEAEALLFGFFDKLLSLRRMQSAVDRYQLESLRRAISEHCRQVKNDESIKNNPGLWLQKKIINAPQIDEVLVRACRCVVAEYLEDLVAAEQAENALTEVIKVNLDGLTVAQFIDQVVLMPGRVADKVLVSFASRAFASRICVWQLDLYADERLHCLAGGDEDLSVLPVFFGELHLLLRGERYDLMYEAWAEPGAGAESGNKESAIKRARPTAQESNVAKIITKLRTPGNGRGGNIFTDSAAAALTNLEAGRALDEIAAHSRKTFGECHSRHDIESEKKKETKRKYSEVKETLEKWREDLNHSDTSLVLRRDILYSAFGPLSPASINNT